MLPGLGPVHLLMVLVVALLVLGPTKLPELARHLGAAMQMYRDMRDRLHLDLDPRTAVRDHVNTVVETVLEGPDEAFDGEFVDEFGADLADATTAGGHPS